MGKGLHTYSTTCHHLSAIQLRIERRKQLVQSRFGRGFDHDAAGSTELRLDWLVGLSRMTTEPRFAKLSTSARPFCADATAARVPRP